MTDLTNSRFLRALRQQPVDRTPVWIMRQAGRYLPEYRKTREKAGDFLSLCSNPELACEVTLQPLRRYALDAAILFSDILTIPDAMGLGLYFAEGEGPRFHQPIRDIHAIERLLVPQMTDDLAYVMNAVQLIRQEMPQNLPLIGFSGSPWTLACYMVEGQSSRDFKHILRMVYTEDKAIHKLLNTLALSASAYLVEQIKAGVNAVMIFDTWGGILTPSNYQRLSLSYMQEIVQHVKSFNPDIPVILFTKGGGQWLEQMADTGCDALGLDWTCDLHTARQRVGSKVALQGNLDPAVLLGSSDAIRREVANVLAAYGQGSGHIFNLGHGITPDVPPENVAVMVDALQELSPQYHVR
ncbi:uroporphyrinogen decarboxylase [Legionella sp. km772]|uniref:uroporphyrinogen decarboxylase n=1 Tax=Legionella sp. km772 TaxID=2498111 RepID=UPI000F8ECF3D|nr:uroporphyrinogen decarboxylase [Legionella sp. km772]RUR08809.1 uroporphyrinogen decarboxylase [Legionella sp. km772]